MVGTLEIIFCTKNKNLLFFPWIIHLTRVEKWINIVLTTSRIQKDSVAQTVSGKLNKLTTNKKRRLP